MIFDESVQLPAFPKKITRNAFERSYMKRIINVKMNEFSPLNTSTHQNMFGVNSHNQDSFLMTNSYSQGFPQVMSRGSQHQQQAAREGKDLQSISPIGHAGGGNITTLQEDSLFKPSIQTVPGIDLTPHHHGNL
jgi:hypothetical protein